MGSPLLKTPATPRDRGVAAVCIRQYNGPMRHFARFVLIFCLMVSLSCLGPRTGQASVGPVIHIHSPGEGSMVTSPVHILADIRPGAGGVVRLTLTDADQVLLARRLWREESGGDGALALDLHLVFEIPGAASTARLSLSTQDAFQRPIALRSVLLTLQGAGQAVVMPPIQPEPWIALESPAPGSLHSGGVVPLTGTVSPVNGSPVIFELITETGGVVGAAQLAVPEGQTGFDFSLDLPYSFIQETREVRLVMRQKGLLIPGDVVLDSLVVFLGP